VTSHLRDRASEELRLVSARYGDDRCTVSGNARNPKRGSLSLSLSLSLSALIAVRASAVTHARKLRQIDEWPPVFAYGTHYGGFVFYGAIVTIRQRLQA